MIRTAVFSSAAEHYVEGWDRVRSWYAQDREEHVLELRVSDETLMGYINDIPPRSIPTVGDVAKQLVKLRAFKGLRRYGRKHGNR